MNYWLVKSEPIKYPWEKLVQDKKTVWDGVRNYQARNTLQAMKKAIYCYITTVTKDWRLLELQKYLKNIFPIQR